MSRKKKSTKRLTKKQKKARAQLWAILIFVVGVLFTAMAFIEADGWLGAVQDFCFGLMSGPFYLFGPMLLYMSVQIALDKLGKNPRLRALVTGLLFVLLVGAVQVYSPHQPAGESFLSRLGSLYHNGKDLRGGGLLSAPVALLMGLFPPPYDKIVMGLLLFVAVMLSTGTTLRDLIRGAAKPVVEVGAAYQEKVAQNAQLQQEAQKNETLPKESPPKKMPGWLASLDPARQSAKPSKKADKEPSVPSKDKLIEAARSLEEAEEDIQTTLEPDTPPPSEEPGPSEENLAYLSALIKSKTKQAAPSQPESSPAHAELAPVGGGLYITPETEENLAGQLTFEPSIGSPLPPAAYRLPDLSLLHQPARDANAPGPEELTANAQRLVDTLQSFGVQTKIIDISSGPAVTRYELQPAAGVKISRITSLSDDIALGLATSGVRIEAPIPNKSAVGIEVPNRRISPVVIREVIESPAFAQHPSPISFALGRDISGGAVIADIAKMPHLLIAGATGSGKSVCINSIIVSLLYRAKPTEVKLLMIDPKVVELGVYNGLPHLLVPVVTDPKKAAGALGWAVGEMLRRYQLFAEQSVRDITGYNRLSEQPDGPEALPHVVIIIDELSDLMMASPSEVEDYICRLAQMARAAGMHLVIATQRPSVDVITGIIKANIPSRISFAVSSQIDSRTILDMGGAEKLLGQGDMLYYPSGAPKPVRVQGCYVTEEEVSRVVSFITAQDKADYSQEIIEEIDRQTPAEKGGRTGAGTADDDQDPMLPDAIEVVVEAGMASTSLLQRRLKLGYARAARIMDEMEAAGVVGPFEGSKPRQVLISRERWLEMRQNQD